MLGLSVWGIKALGFPGLGADSSGLWGRGSRVVGLRCLEV